MSLRYPVVPPIGGYYMRRTWGALGPAGTRSRQDRQTFLPRLKADKARAVHTHKQRERDDPGGGSARHEDSRGEIKSVVNYLTKAATAYSREPEPYTVRHKRKRRLITAPEYHSFNNEMDSIARATLLGTMTMTTALVRTLDEIEKISLKPAPGRVKARRLRHRQITGRELVTEARTWQRAHPHATPTQEIRKAHRLLSQRSKLLPCKQELKKTLRRCQQQLMRRRAIRPEPTRSPRSGRTRPQKARSSRQRRRRRRQNDSRRTEPLQLTGGGPTLVQRTITPHGKLGRPKAHRAPSSKRARSRRAQARRDAAAKVTDEEDDEYWKGCSSNRHRYHQLTPEEAADLMAKRANPEADITEQELEELLSQPNSSLPTETQTDQPEPRTVQKTKVPIYGTLRVDKKLPTAIRFFSANINGLRYWHTNNYKANRLKHVFQQYGVDSCGLQEVCLNWSAFKPSQTLATLLRNGAEQIRSVAAHYKPERPSLARTQRGGTATIIRNELAGYVRDSGVDWRNLGRWSWYKLEGETGHKTYVVSAYMPCRSTDDPRKETAYQVQMNYIKSNLLKTDPRKLFQEDICDMMLKWRADKARIILMMDANDPVNRGQFCKRLTHPDLGMREAVHSVTQGQGPKTYYKGKDAIDGIWVTQDIEVISASYLPFHADIGDHRPVMADLTTTSVLGNDLPRLVYPRARRLNAKVTRIRERYTDALEKLVSEHRLYERLQALEQAASFPVSREVKEALEKFDRQLTDFMIRAEKGCRKLHSGDYEFSPKVKALLDKCHAYKALLRIRQTKSRRGLRRKGNKGNAYRFARRCGIAHGRSRSTKALVEEFRACKEETKRHLAQSPWMRRQFLTDKLREALQKHDSEEAQRVKDILRNENQARQWAGIRRGLNQKRTGAFSTVEVPQPKGPPIKCTVKEDVEAAIHEEIDVRFGRADSAPICRGPLFDLLGYTADTDAAVEILQGTFKPPEGTSEGTKIILREIARIWQLLEAKEIDIRITQEDFRYYWSRAKERTSSSRSGRHFGHYCAAAFSSKLSKLHALHLSIITRTGCAPDRWAQGLSVMLEKVAGVALVTKLRAILLLEADFNCHNRLIFGSRMLRIARDNKLVPEEIYSAKGKTAEDAILHQVLVYDLARQWKRPIVVSSVDASQCYDRIAHAPAALVMRAFKVAASSVVAMLRPIQRMRYYLRTGHGESKTYSGGDGNVKQGGCQGNTATPALWQQISTVMLNAQKAEGHGITITTPISKKSASQAGILFVDDTNLWAGMAEDDDLVTAMIKAQEGNDQWGGSLIETGGEQNPDKCAFTVGHMIPAGKGSWKYHDSQRDNKQDGEDQDAREEEHLRMTVPQADGRAVNIQHLKSSEAVENLGLFARPDGDCSNHLRQLAERIEDWTTRVKNGALPTRSVWLSYAHQLWAGLRYGLGASAAKLKDIEKEVEASDFYLLSQLGVVRTIKKGWRYLTPQFCGIGLHNIGVEATIASINALLQHYGAPTNLGITLQASIEALQLELGVPDNPFQYPFEIWGELATDSWVKSLWERIDSYDIALELDYTPIQPPRQHDKSIMVELVNTHKWRGAKLQRANRARQRNEALFLSDLANASGTGLEPHLLDDWTESLEATWGKHRSSLTFSPTDPNDEDWRTWRGALRLFTTGGYRLQQPLGKWTSSGHRIWRTTTTDEGALAIAKDTGKEIWHNDPTSKLRNIFTRTREKPNDASPSQLASVEKDRRGSLRVTHRSKPFQEQPAAEEDTLETTLLGWGGAWMWADTDLTGDMTWLAEGIKNGTLTAVADGSYDRHRDKEVCSAGWIVVCRATKKWITGSFAERSNSASSYRGELLGMLAVHLLLLATEQLYRVTGSNTQVLCDNKGALTTFARKEKRIPPARRNSDIRRVIRNIQSRTKSAHLLRHVRAHQDDSVSRRQLSLEARLNCICDDLAKDALVEESHHPQAAATDLPCERARVLIDGKKATSDLGDDMREAISWGEARKLYTDSMMSEEAFDDVAWEDLGRAMKGKPKMYQLWLAKQTASQCGTGDRLAQRKKGKKKSTKEGPQDAAPLQPQDYRCPSCHRPGKETADHLCRCTSATRRHIMRLGIDRLEAWLEENNTQGQLRRWIPRYIERQGFRQFEQLDSTGRGPWMSGAMRAAARAQDAIGFRHFMEGKISHKIRTMQHEHLTHSGANTHIDTWMKTFITKILEITHAQWICRNMTKHHHTKGAKLLHRKEAVLAEIERQLSIGISGLPEESACLLEIDTQTTSSMSLHQQEYWVAAVEASRVSAAAANELTNGRTASWSKFCNHQDYHRIPSKPKAPLRQPTEPAPPTLPERTPAPPAEQDTPPKPLPGGPRRNPHTETPGAPRRARKGNRTPEQKERKPITKAAKPKYKRHTHRHRWSAAPLISATSRDPHGLLTAATRAHPDAKQIDDALQRRRIRTPHRDEDFTIAEVAGQTIKRDSMPRLAAGRWLSDDIIDFVLRGIVLPNLSGKHIYSTHFYSKLTGGNDDRGPEGYFFAEVQTWARRIQGGILSLEELYIPINKNSNHWMVARVKFLEKRVEAWDSLGPTEDASAYLQNILRYVYDASTHAGANLPPFPRWASDWTCTDESRRSPRQENGTDCGLFTILSTALMAHGCSLQRNSYTQATLETRNTRRTIAHLIWSRRTHPHAESLLRPDPPCPQTAHNAKRKRPRPSSGTKKRRRRRDNAIVTGSAELRSPGYGWLPTQQEGNRTTNRKRTAKSAATPDPSLTETSQRCLPPERKRRRPAKQAAVRET